MEDKAQSTIEDISEVSPVGSLSCKTFANTRPLWLPPQARGIYGGIYMAQSLNAAKHTVPPDCLVHVIRCQFLLPGNVHDHLVYHVTNLSDGKSFASRCVKVTQQTRVVFIATIGFTRGTSRREECMEHAEPFPGGVPAPSHSSNTLETVGHDSERAPYLTSKAGIVNSKSHTPDEKYIHHWSKSSQVISLSGGTHAHQAALAYICDNYSIGTVPHVHGIWDFVKPPLTEFQLDGEDLSGKSAIHRRIPPSGEESTESLKRQPRRVSMMVTINHTMFFHAPTKIKADEWMLMELSSHWSGSGRGLVTQKIWTKDGILIATCFQEGIVRLTPPSRQSRL